MRSSWLPVPRRCKRPTGTDLYHLVKLYFIDRIRSAVIIGMGAVEVEDGGMPRSAKLVVRTVVVPVGVVVGIIGIIQLQFRVGGGYFIFVR